MLAPPSMPPAAATSNAGLAPGTGIDAALPRMLPLTPAVRTAQSLCPAILAGVTCLPLCA